MTFCEQCWRFVVSRCIKQKYSGNRKTNKSYRSCQYKEIHGNNTTENCNFTNKNANRQHSDHAPNKWWICHPFIVELMAFLFVCMCVLHYVAALQFMSFILWNSALCASPYRDLACDSNCLSSTRMNLTGWQKKNWSTFLWMHQVTREIALKVYASVDRIRIVVSIIAWFFIFAVSHWKSLDAFI